MRLACMYAEGMKLLQVRNVPDDVHLALKVRAAQEGTTMSELVLRELPRIAAKPTMKQWLERAQRLSPVGGPSAADLIAEGRAERDAELDAGR